MRTNPARGPEGLPRRIAAQPIDQGAWDTGFPASGDAVEGRYIVGPGKLISRRIAEPVPPELPGLPPRPRVLQLTDGDCVSHGLANGTRHQRASDQEVRSCLDRVHATARLLDPHARIRCAVSTETAIYHLAVLAAARNNLFTIRRGLDGADWALLEELADLIDVRMVAARPGRKRSAQVADLVILVGKDGIYAPPVRRLRLLGIPTWLLVPGRSAATSLRRASCAVSYIGPQASSSVPA